MRTSARLFYLLLTNHMIARQWWSRGSTGTVRQNNICNLV